jgi:hypothetical protein
VDSDEATYLQARSRQLVQWAGLRRRGWIGVASIKWVGDIDVSDEPLFSY